VILIWGGRGLFEAVEVAVDRMKDRLTVPALPARLGLPLELKKITPPKEFDSHVLQNPTVTYLRPGCNPNGSGWGYLWDGIKWLAVWSWFALTARTCFRACGSTLSLLSIFLAALFWRFDKSGMDRESIISKEGVLYSKEGVLYQMSPKSFELFCTGFFNYKKATDLKWDNFVSVPDIVGSPAKVKGLHDNFHKLKKFL
jgi:hypothetical protein